MKKVLIILLGSIMLLSFVKHDGYPVPPKNKRLLFYIQRNHNKNTIVYDANFDVKGMLVDNDPISVYWIRYEEQGQKMELRTIEKWYAYGIKCDKIDGRKDYYRIKLAANEKRKFWLKQEAPYKATVYTEINSKICILDNIYIYADESGIWPKVLYVELFGEDSISKQAVYEKVNY